MKKPLLSLAFIISLFAAFAQAPTLNINTYPTCVVAGDTVQFGTTNHFTNYLWNFGDPASGTLDTSTVLRYVQHIYSTPGIYNVKLYVVYQGGLDSASTVITVLGAQVSPSSANVCSGTNTTLIASGGGGGFVWSTGDTTAAINVSPTSTTTYTVTVSAGAGCFVTASATVNTKPALVVSPASASICPGGSATFNASGATSYVWSNSTNGSSITVSPASTTTYTVTATGGGCTATQSVTVNVGATLLVTTTPPNATVCQGASTTLTAIQGSTYTWSTGATTQSITVTPVTATTYNVTVSDGGGCTGTGSATVGINANPNAQIVPAADTVCRGGFRNISATGGATYLWSFGATTANVRVSPLVTTNYSVTVTSAAGCTATASRTVIVADTIVAVITPGQATICDGQNLNLTASGGGVYAWSSGQTFNTINVSPDSSTVYTVTVTTAAGCSSIYSAVVLVNPSPMAGVTATLTSVCNGQSTTLTATGGVGYAWSNGANGAVQTVSPSALSIYTVTVTGANNCASTASERITVNPSPDASINPGVSSVCKGAKTTLTAQGGGSYLWNTGATTTAISVSPTVPTTYSITATNGSGCTATASASVTIDTFPVASIFPKKDTVCSGQKTTLIGLGGSSYAWSSGDNTQAVFVYPSVQNNTYVVTVTNSGGCSSTASIALNVKPVPNVTISPINAAVCVGSTVTLTATGGGTYLWSTGGTNAGITVSPTANTVYYVSVTGKNGCPGIDSALVTANAALQPLITPSSPVICIGDSIGLSVTAAASYHWSTGAFSQNITVTPGATTTYSITAFNNSNCSATASATVTVSLYPVIAFTPSPDSICAGTSTTLSASGGTVYQWNTGSPYASITVSPANTTSYTVTVTNAAGCASTASTSVAVSPQPSLTITPSAVTLCGGSGTTLDAVVTGIGGNANYTWSNGANTASISVTPATSTVYTVTVIGQGECSVTGTRTVTINPTPIASISTLSDTICSGTTTILTASGGNVYSWSGGAGTSPSISINPTQNTSYTVTVSFAGAPNCTATATVNIVVKPTPTLLVTASSNNICNGSPVTITATGNGISDVWNTGATTPSITLNPTDTITYSVTSTDANGCSITDSITVDVKPAVATVAPAVSSICVGKSVTIFAISPYQGTTYTWSTSSNKDSITVSPNITTSYVVTATGTNGCSSTATALVIADSILVPAIAPSNPTICGGQVVTLASSAASTYAWSSGATTRTISVSPLQTTTYTITATNGQGCSGTAEVVVNVNPAVTAAINPPGLQICNGSSATLTASGGSTYRWSNGNDSASITVNSKSTKYIVTVSDVTGCSATAEAELVVRGNPGVEIIAGSNTVCSGASTTLTAVGGGGGGGPISYVWFNGSTSTTINVSPVTASVYTVTVTNDVTGCTAAASQNISVTPSPTVTISPTFNLCFGNSATLVATGGTGVSSYRWSNGIAGSTLTVTPASTTSYTVTVTGTGNCTAVATRTVFVDQPPVVTITVANDTICKGLGTTLTASGLPIGFFQWSDGSTSNPTAVQPSVTSTYYIQGQDANHCNYSASATVNVVNVTAAINPVSSALCTGQSDTLVASGNGTYLWNTGSTASTIIVTPTGGHITDYSVTVTGSNNCSASAGASINVQPSNLIFSVSPPIANICKGSAITLTAAHGGTYVWSNRASTESILVAPDSTTTYTVTMTNGVGCSGTASATITVNGNPTASISPSSTAICFGKTATLTASGNGTYKWSVGGNSASLTLAPTVTTTFTVTVTNSGNCTASASSTVTVNPLPAGAITPATVTACPGSTSVLTATGGGFYLWSNGATTGPVSVSPAATTAYTVTVTTNAGCSATLSRTVTVNPSSAAVTPTAITICNGQHTSITASGGQGQGRYSWSSGATSTSISVNPTQTTTYTVTVTNSTHCLATASSVVTVQPAVATITPGTDTVCNGSSTVLSASAGSIYSWNDGAHSQTTTVSPKATTNYTVTITNTDGCTAVATRTVVVKPKPAISSTPSLDTLCGGTNVPITAVGVGTYVWSTGATTQTINVAPTVTTNYSVTLTAANGCSASSTSSIIIRPVSAAITPAVSALCTGQSDTLTASGGVSYLWSTGSTATTIYVTPNVTTIYTVTVTGTNGCTAAASATVNVNTNLVPVITPSNPSVCPGNSVTLVVTAGTSYNWSNGLTSQSIKVTPVSTTTYTVTVNNGAGCSGTASVNVNVNTLPTATVTPANDTICSGFGATLTASGGNSYVWSTLDTGAVLNVAPVNTTTYTVTVTSSSNCSATATGVVTVLNNPTANIVPANDTICSGTNVTLQASGGNTYTWSTSATGSSISVTPLTTTVYSVTASIGFCSASANAVVTVNTSPQPDITVNVNPICSGQSDTLSASGGIGYLWSTGSDSITTIVTPSITSTYTVTATDANGCSGTASATVNVNTSPNVSVTPADTSICAGSDVVLTATGGGTYVWSANSTSPTIDVSPVTTTVYTVTVTGSNTCTATASGTVNVNTLPSILINPPSASICAGSNVTLSAIGAVNYTWSNSSTTSSITVSPATNTTYSVSATDNNGCSGSASASVSVNSNPVASATPPTSTICRGGNVTLTATGGGNYSWSSSQTTAIINVSPATTTTYTVTVTNTITSCSATASSVITVDTVNATINPALSSICTGQNVTITATGGGTYAWSNSSTAASISVSPANTTTYTVTVTGTNTCSASLSATVNVNGTLVPVITPANPAVCAGGTITLNVTSGSTYTWSTGATTQSISVSPTAGSNSYSVTVDNGGGCSGTATVSVQINTNPIANASATTSSICSGASDTLTASGGISYAWSNSADTSVIVVAPQGTTTYTVTVTDANSCSATASASITVNTTPVAGISPALDTICSGQPAILTAQGGSTYQWSNSQTTQSITDHPSSNTSYDVTVFSEAGCSASASALVTVNQQPTATVSPDTISVCSGQGGTFTAFDSTGIGTGYIWSDGEITNVITVAPASTTTYTVTISSFNCSATASGVLVVDSVPPAAISPATSSVCSGNSTTLTASGGTGYSWSTGDNSQSISVSPTGTTVYTVTVYSSSGCSATATASVTVNTPPTASVDPSSTNVCSGSPVTFTANGGTSYSWSSGETTESITETPVATTVYLVTVTDDNGCSATSSGTANVTTITPQINPGTSTTCAGQSENLTASGADSYVWSTGDLTATISVSPQTTTTYFVTATDQTSGCTATASATVNVNSAPNAAVDPAVSSICTGQSVVLTASGGVSYAWSDNTSNSTDTVTPESTTTYTVTVTDANNCSATASALVNANATLQPVISPATPAVCPGGSVTLTVTGGSSYAWSTGDTTQSTTVSPNTATVYNVTVSNGPGCSGTASVSVTINTAPSVDFSPAKSFTVCSGEEVTVTASGGVQYAWSTGDDIATITVQPVSDTLFIVTVTDNNGCTATGGVPMSILPTTDTILSASVCAGSTYTFFNQVLTTSGTYSDTLIGSNGCDSIVYLNLQFIKYFTDSLNASFCLGSSYSFNNQNLSTPGYYTDTVTSSGGCDSIVILNLALITPGITIKTVFCQDTGYTYHGTVYTQQGTYLDTLTNSQGCDSVVTLILDTVAHPAITWDVNTTICNTSQASTVNIPPASPTGGAYSGTGVSGSTLTLGAGDTGTFVVTYTLQGGTGCPGTVTKTFNVSLCVGIDEVSIENSLELYPNPVNEMLSVESALFTTDNATPVIRDLSGKVLSVSYTRKANKFMFDTESLAAGAYFVQVNIQGIVVSRKFVKVD